MSASRVLDVAIMRGGTSRGVVLRLDAAPTEGGQRDALARALIGRTLVDGLGGGTPITNTVVLVGQARSAGTELDYIVGNVSSNGEMIDWSGTCGNMTSAVVPFAYQTNLCARPPDARPFRLCNLATGGIVEVTVTGGETDLSDEGAEVKLRTSFRDPGGAVLGQTLPTGQAHDVIDVVGDRFDFSLVDVSHPYLFLLYDQVVGDRDIESVATQARIELIRASVCVRLGLCAELDDARSTLAAVPRVVLLHATADPGAEVRVTAISMGQPIRSVPVTAALSLAAARGIDGTIVGGRISPGVESVLVSGPAGSLKAEAEVDQAGRVLSASVERSARTLMRGRVWV